VAGQRTFPWKASAKRPRHEEEEQPEPLDYEEEEREPQSGSSDPSASMAARLDALEASVDKMAYQIAAIRQQHSDAYAEHAFFRTWVTPCALHLLSFQVTGKLVIIQGREEHLIESSRTSSAALAGIYATTRPSQVLNLILKLMQAPARPRFVFSSIIVVCFVRADIIIVCFFIVGVRKFAFTSGVLVSSVGQRTGGASGRVRGHPR